MPLVNKRELASILDISLPTLDSLIDRHGDAFPIVQRGSNGVAWQFDPEAVTAFLRAYQAREEAELAARAEALDQFRLPGLEPAPTPAGAKPKDILDTLRAQRLQHDMAKQAGHLVWTTQVRQQLVTAVTLLNTFLHGLPGQCGRRFNLPDAVVTDMARLIADQQVEFQCQLRELLNPSSDAA